MEIRSLTKAEAEIMKILWQLKKGFIKDILAKMEDPKPAYTTVATFLKILEKKQVVSHRTYGNSHEFYPLISEEDYRKHEVDQLMENYFDNSVANLVSFFVKEKGLDEQDFNALTDYVEKNKKTN
ncbi:BlaI/MecI/CopY family transcriptional regulator [Arundinibacter roseus]|uniref:BlaI/MecI/CopY family transcriptional regulator n=1 Tax=Arundinibacter roseus TaxID=2070510 RepID=A0A4R4KHA5_9BACT|nr:BlaI/MecI/CopY family transcriptional regulator [Arundinibacter roseus]TDB67398.1 BlaI/MecI/CopY family transcriptional regulator [Arundinibacter roseus]